ncbi:MFS transporter [Pseudomonas syringae]
MAHNNNKASYENVLLCVLFLTFGFVFFDRLALSFLFPFTARELQLSNSHLGMLSSVLALAWAISGTLVGAWSDRRGVRKPLLIAAVILFSLCSALSGLVAGFLSLLLFRAIMGLAEGPILPLSQSMMVEASSPHRRGLNMGLLQGSAAGLLGAVIGPPVLIALAQAYGWRHAFIVSLLPGLLIAWLIWRYVRRLPPTGSRRMSSSVQGGCRRATNMLYMAVVGAIAITFPGLPGWVDPTWNQWCLIGILSITGVVAQLLLIQSLRYATAGSLQPFNYTLLVFATCIGVFVFGEIPDAWTLVGASLVIIGGLYAIKA